MYRALIPLIIDVQASTLDEARDKARKIAEQLTALPSATMSSERVTIFDLDGTQLYPTPPCIRCGDKESEERYDTEGLCNYCAHIVDKEMNDDV